MMHDGFVILLFAGVIAIGVASFAFRRSRGATLLDKWAADNNFSIVNYERRYLTTGPFFFRKGKGQDVYYVTVTDSSGRARSAYVRVGGMFLGMMSDQVTVKWDE